MFYIGKPKKFLSFRVMVISTTVAAKQKAKKAKDFAGVDEELFELLRAKRAELARKQGVPSFIIFGDKSLKDMASRKPSTRAAFSEVFGVE
jgi:ATP-dependent DNA helicase RecQ